MIFLKADGDQPSAFFIFEPFYLFLLGTLLKSQSAVCHLYKRVGEG